MTPPPARARALARRVLLPLALAAVPGRATAQGWWVDASAGRVSDRGVAAPVSSTGAALVLRRDGVDWWAFAGGGAPLDGEGVPWAAAGAGARVGAALRGLPVGIDLAARGFAYRDADSIGGGITLEALPFVAVVRDNVRAELAAGVLHSSRSDTAGSVSRTLGATRARVSMDRGPLALAAEARYWRATEGGYPFVGGSARVTRGRASAWAEAGTWLSDRVDGPAWGAGAGYAVLPGTQLYASAARETNDPLYRLAPRQSWSIGVSHRLGRAPVEAAAPAPIARAAEGRVTFRLPRSAAAAAPSVGGDFNRWQPVAMAAEGDDWVAVVPLSPGVYHYAFRAGAGGWFVPEGTPGRADDGFGGVSAILVVP